MLAKFLIISTFLLIGILLSVAKASPQTSQCAFKSGSKSIHTQTLTVESKAGLSESEDYDDNDDDEDAEFEDTIIMISNETDTNNELCKKSQNFCHTLWKTNDNGTNEIISQGCWSSCPNSMEQCIGEATRKDPNLKFCCCSGDFCNNVFSGGDSPPTTTEIPPHKAPKKSLLDSFVVWICILLVGVIITVIIFYVSGQTKSTKEPEAAPLATGYPSGPGYSSNLYNVDNLKLVDELVRGKYGTVMKGILNEQPVAVKIYNAKHRHIFLNEKDIYSQPFMETPEILTYLGCDERRTLEGEMQYLIVLSLMPLGCLQGWLIENTTSYEIFCGMAKSIVRGLSHLHTEIKRGDLSKLCICHRDLNTKNILVKPDLTCCLCDFGFSMKLNGSRYEYRGEMILAETKSINEVGTLRYMAPEELEGAVNLRDCMTSLKQIDVYSLGLVLWELCMRCNDFYPPEQATPPYKAPYEAEIGNNPTFEQMQVLVSRYKARPLFPASWGGGPAARIAKETCEDCWDHDGEARVTALCVEERLNEMCTLKPRAGTSRGASPPLSKNNLLPTTSPSVVSTSPTFKENNVFSTIITPPNQSIPSTAVVVTNHVNEHTVETMISSTTPNGSINGTTVQINKNNELFSRQIQPFQGKNPCMERNLAPSNYHGSPANKGNKKFSVSNGGTNINLNSNDHYINMEDEVFVEEFLNRNIPSATISGSQHLFGEGLPKQNNTDKKQNRWIGVRDLLKRKLFKRNQEGVHNVMLSNEELSSPTNNAKAPINRNIHLNLIESHQAASNANPSNGFKHINGDLKTHQNTIITRPSNLDISPIVVSRITNTHKLKKHPNDEQKFTVVNSSPRIVISKSANAVKNLNNSHRSLNDDSTDNNLKRQRSLEVFREVFGPKGSIERLRDVNQRIKTPGDVPASVRKVRASKTLSLYDDRMMDPGQFIMPEGNSV